LKERRNVTSSAALSTPLGKDSVVLKVISRIKEALINRDIRPGDYLPSEEELTRNLGVGKSSVREAVKMLQAMGVAEVRRGQGTVIREQPGEDILEPMIFQLILQEGDISDLIDLRMMFEPAYSLMAMKRADEADLQRIRETISHFEDVIAQGKQTAADDIAFHLEILRTTYNPYVIKIGETILELFTGLKINYHRLFLHYGYFDIWVNFFEQLMIIVPYLIMGPGLFTGMITLGVLVQVSNAFSKVRESFSIFIANWTTITELRSIHKRLKEFELNIGY